VASFHVGSREFDPAVVGLATAEGPNTMLFDTTQPGNANTGHEFGTTLGESEKADLLEYLKSL